MCFWDGEGQPAPSRPVRGVLCKLSASGQQECLKKMKGERRGTEPGRVLTLNALAWDETECVCVCVCKGDPSRPVCQHVYQEAKARDEERALMTAQSIHCCFRIIIRTGLYK